MGNIPQDPYLLYSYVNAELRDEYDTFADFCSANNVPAEELTDILASAGFSYDASINQFR